MAVDEVERGRQGALPLYGEEPDAEQRGDHERAPRESGIETAVGEGEGDDGEQDDEADADGPGRRGEVGVLHGPGAPRPSGQERAEVTHVGGDQLGR